MQWLGLYNYWIVIFLMMTGFYIVISSGNLVKKIVGLNVFQTSVFILYISMSKVEGGTPPIIADGFSVYSNPLPHVLILTAIVVGVATTALGLALVVRIRESYGSVEEEDIDVDEQVVFYVDNVLEAQHTHNVGEGVDRSNLHQEVADESDVPRIDGQKINLCLPGVVLL